MRVLEARTRDANTSRLWQVLNIAAQASVNARNALTEQVRFCAFVFGVFFWCVFVFNSNFFTRCLYHLLCYIYVYSFLSVG